MTMRKPNKAEQIVDLKNEINTVEIFMTPMVREAERLDATSKTRTLTLPERKRLNELIDIIHEKNVWLAKANETLGAYFAPATA